MHRPICRNYFPVIESNGNKMAVTLIQGKVKRGSYIVSARSCNRIGREKFGPVTSVLLIPTLLGSNYFPIKIRSRCLWQFQLNKNRFQSPTLDISTLYCLLDTFFYFSFKGIIVQLNAVLNNSIGIFAA